MADDRKRLLQRWASIRGQVDAALTETDPAHLLAAGAPPGEYDDAVDHFTSAVVRDNYPTAADIDSWFLTHYGIGANDPTALENRLAGIADRSAE